LHRGAGGSPCADYVRASYQGKRPVDILQPDEQWTPVFTLPAGMPAMWRTYSQGKRMARQKGVYPSQRIHKDGDGETHDLITIGTATLYTDDAVKFLSVLQDASVDLMVCSPPYFMGKEYDTSLSVADFVAIHRLLLPNLLRVLKLGGNLCWQVGHHVRDGVTIPLDAVIYATFAEAEQLFLRNRIIWTFGHGVHAKRRFSGRHETIMWYSKGKDYFFNLDPVRIPQKYPGKRHYKGPKKGEWSGNPRGKNPSDVWDIPNVKAGHVEKIGHPCQFPVALVQRLIRSLSPSNGTVADPFMGSGSSAVAAAIEGRTFLGCDCNQKYVKMTETRLQQLAAGTLKYRLIGQPIHAPISRHAVSQRPPHFISEKA
jgi:adenine-specific DNA-methyltransferase